MKTKNFIHCITLQNRTESGRICASRTYTVWQYVAYIDNRRTPRHGRAYKNSPNFARLHIVLAVCLDEIKRYFAMRRELFDKQILMVWKAHQKLFARNTNRSPIVSDFDPYKKAFGVEEEEIDMGSRFRSFPPNWV